MKRTIATVAILVLSALPARPADVVLGRVSDLQWLGAGADRVASWATAAVFTPADVDGLALWVDATDACYTNTAGTIAASVGDAVGHFPDKSGNARHMTALSNNGRPVLASVNGKRCLYFDDTGDPLQSPAFAAGPALTVIVVAKRNWLNSGGKYRTLYTHSDVDAIDNNGGGSLATAGGTAYDWISTDMIVTGNGFGPGRAPRAIGIMSQAGTNAVVIGAYIGASTGKVWAGGTNVTRSALSAALPRAGSSYPARIGYGITSNPFDGYIFELAAYTNAMSDYDFGRVITNMMSKWGIP